MESGQLTQDFFFRFESISGPESIRRALNFADICACPTGQEIFAAKPIMNGSSDPLLGVRSKIITDFVVESTQGVI